MYTTLDFNELFTSFWVLFHLTNRPPLGTVGARLKSISYFKLPEYEEHSGKRYVT